MVNRNFGHDQGAIVTGTPNVKVCAQDLQQLRDFNIKNKRAHER